MTKPDDESQAAVSPTTAFVLAGGGSLGAVQVGMLKALIGAGIVPDMVVGASVGAINGACLAGQPDMNGIARLEQIWLGLTRQRVFPLSPWGMLCGLLQHRNYLMSPQGLADVITDGLPCKRLEDTRLPFHAVATDLLSGKAVTLSSGPATEALLASAAIPAVFPPVRLGGCELVDGGLASNTPMRTAVALGATRLIVLPTGLSCALKKPPSSVLGMAMHALNVLIMQQLREDSEALEKIVELHIVPPVCPVTVGSHDFSQTRQLIERAEHGTTEWLDAGGLEKSGRAMLDPHRH
ncbi:MAG TPA: patatin-like phospholipase family protein [Stenotrophobium sp.]|nr:patatin-like phospholipase family protein [Stenotrophobium sp.]